ncbi:MAG: MBL fold metallo-hydrolase [Chitinophagales bacterium]|nr:MBL fold metallo-hydrolase [Chitinophagales bacterium]
MIQLHQFIFNDFQENTYVLWDETNECIVIDPGCYYEEERNDLQKFIEGKNLKPVLLLNTHCHIDHVFGNKWVKEKYKVPFYCNQKELYLLNALEATGKMYGMHVAPSPQPDRLIDESDEIKFGNTTLKIFFTPGHSAGSVCFYYDENNTNTVSYSGLSTQDSRLIISGDVLFQNSIGRFDLPGGDYETLMQSIFNKLMILPDEVKVYSGHGPATTIGVERRNNPFLLEYAEAKK